MQPRTLFLPAKEGSQVVTVHVEHEGDGMMAIAKDAFSRWDSVALTIPPDKLAKMRENFVAAGGVPGIE